MRSLLATLTLALAMAGLAYAQVDVVELKNGDRISGSIKEMDGEFLIIDTPYTEKLKIDWKEVVAVTTDKPFVVRIKPDKYVNARIVRQGDGMSLESEDLRSARPIMPDEIATIGIPPGAQWDGIIGASIGGTSGNYPHNFNVGGLGEVVRRTDDDRLRIGLAGEHGETKDQTKVFNAMGEQIGVENNSSITTASNVRGWTLYDYFLGPHWGVGGFGKLEHDRIKDINLRTIVGAGPRYRFFDTKTEHFSLYVGGAYVNETFIDNSDDDRDYFSAALGDEFMWKFPWGLTLVQRLDVYPSLEDTSDVLFNFFFGPRYTLANGLFTGVSFNWDYDTKPARFRERNDFRYLGTFGYEF